MTEDEQDFETWILAETGQPYHEWLYDRKREAIRQAEQRKLETEAYEEEAIRQAARAAALEQARLERVRQEAEQIAQRRALAEQHADELIAALPPQCVNGETYLCRPHNNLEPARWLTREQLVRWEFNELSRPHGSTLPGPALYAYFDAPPWADDDGHYE